VAHSPTTYLALPTIHSGRALDGTAAMRDIYARDVIEGSFVASLARAGYDAMALNPVLGMCPTGVTCEYQEAITLGRGAALVDSSRFLVELALYRVAPESFKGAILRKNSTGQRHVAGSDHLLKDLASGLQASGKRPTVRFLHLFSTHPPIAFDADCGHAQGVAWARASALAQARCALRRVSALLEALRQRGIYDKTAIVIVADHGAGFARATGGSGPGAQWGAFASPIFLAKPFGAGGNLVVSSRLVGLLDVAATVCTWTRACDAPDGGDVLAPAPGHKPGYPFNAYVWDHKYWLEERVPISGRYLISGPPSEPQSWRLVASAAVSRVKALHFSAADPQEAFGSGWSSIEQEQRWATGDASELYIDLDPSRDARLEMSVLTHQANAGQSMVVEVNGTALGEMEVPVGNPATLRIDVPRRVIRPEVDRVVFRYRKSSPPPGGQDPRPLAVLFLHLEVATAP